MPYKVLVADDDDGQRKSHGFALEVVTAILGDEIEIVETATSVDTWAKIKCSSTGLPRFIHIL